MGAGVPAKNPARWLAPATPVFAGSPAPTGAASCMTISVCAGTLCRCFNRAHQRFIGHLVPVTRKCGA
ncbi:hypothetical protein EGJ15_06200 [Pseudomonas sp. p99-361]|nr:hypothetical protein EGJ15_06200 [Pseudomonas sp. p99-361]